MDVRTAADVVSDIATSGAVVVGGAWGYLKFIRGRVFSYRAELDVSAAFEQGGPTIYLSVTVTLRNAGLSKLPLNEKMKALRIFGLVPGPAGSDTPPTWQRIVTLPILASHAWLEAQETVTDTAIYGVGPGGLRLGYEAYRVEAVVGATRKRSTGTGVRWQSQIVIFPKVRQRTAIRMVRQR